jgi:hypothetical protein
MANPAEEKRKDGNNDGIYGRGYAPISTKRDIDDQILWREELRDIARRGRVTS